MYRLNDSSRLRQQWRPVLQRAWLAVCKPVSLTLVLLLPQIALAASPAAAGFGAQHRDAVAMQRLTAALDSTRQPQDGAAVLQLRLHSFGQRVTSGEFVVLAGQRFYWRQPAVPPASAVQSLHSSHFLHAQHLLHAEDSLHVEDSLHAEGSLSAEGSLHVEGSLSAEGSLHVEDSVHAEGSVHALRLLGATRRADGDWQLEFQPAAALTSNQWAALLSSVSLGAQSAGRADPLQHHLSRRQLSARFISAAPAPVPAEQAGSITPAERPSAD